MEQFRKKLKTVFCVGVIVEVAIVILYETGLLMEGNFATNTTAEFLIATVMDLATIIVIPVALRMMKYGAVQNIIREQREGGHYKVALLRLNMLMLPMLLNTIFYYYFLNVAFIYLAIVLAISLVFVVPSKKRCDQELEICSER